MDRVRVGGKTPVELLPRTGDGLRHLKAGDVVQGRVLKAQTSGELSLRIGGTVVQARSAVPVPLGVDLLFRVLGEERAQGGAGLRLQLLQTLDNTEAGSPLPAGGGPPAAAVLSDGADTTAAETVRNLLRDLQPHSPLKSGQGEDLATTIRQLLKALPDDPASLPRDLRYELLGLLRSRLRDAEQSIQRRAALLFNDAALQDRLAARESSDAAPASRSGLPLWVDAEKILQIPIKALLQDTGVSFESKLKALALALLAEDGSTQPGSSTSNSQASSAGLPAFPANDLKARLLQLRREFLDRDSRAMDPSPDAGTAASSSPGETTGGAARLLPVVDGLLRDIETFQLLSRLTSSFCTFLPLLWKGLREGDIAFKRSRTGGLSPVHYCVLNLDFENFGRLTVVALLHGGDCFLTFRADREVLQSALRDGAHELEEMFLHEGLRLGGISFSGADDPQLASFERLDAFESVLDLKI